MIRYFVIGLAIVMNGATAMPEAAPAEQRVIAPSIKVVNFTADWCPNCRILNPRLAEAIERFDPGNITRIDLDHTDFKSADKAVQDRLAKDIVQQAMDNEVVYLWDWYGGRTGIAVVVSADNGEPLTCLNRSMSVDQIEARLKQSVTLATKAPPGLRRPEGPECPPPMN